MPAENHWLISTGDRRLSTDSGERIFSLGRFAFRLKSVDAALKSLLESLLPENRQSNSDSITTFDLDMPVDTGADELTDLRTEAPSVALAHVLNRALSFHTNAIWLEGSTMIDDRGRAHLLAGGTFAGKTTLSLSVSLALGWKIVCEDITLIDAAQKKILSYARPLSLRQGSIERIERVTGRTIATPQLENWLFDPKLYHGDAIALEYATATLLGPVNMSEPAKLICDEVDTAAFTRELLPISNLLRMPETMEIFGESIAKAKRFVVRHGDLEARHNWLSALSSSL